MTPMEEMETERKLKRNRIATRSHGTSLDKGVLNMLIRNTRLGIVILAAIVAG